MELSDFEKTTSEKLLIKEIENYLSLKYYPDERLNQKDIDEFNDDDFNEFTKSNEEGDKRYHDLNYHFLENFSMDTIFHLAESNFEKREICYAYLTHIELVKFFYHVWNSSHIESRFRDLIQKMTNHLIETANLSTEEYNSIMSDSNHPNYNFRKHYIYYTWWLYVFYPLIEDGPNLIMKLIKFAYLDDAQDMLLYGIYQMPIIQLVPFFKPFLIEIWNQEKTKQRPCFSLWCTGTGSRSQIFRIVKKLVTNGYQIHQDHELFEIFQPVKEQLNQFLQS